jgi:AcrR family transcriptional regulator
VTPQAGGIRDRFRAQMVQEIKDLALRQLAEGGPPALSVNAIAKELGVSGPALYRYVAGRDALLTELIIDAYADLTAALESARPGSAGLADAYRKWALAQPHRYRLLFAAPLPGYNAHDPRLVAAAQPAMNVLLRMLGDDPATDHSLRAITLWSRVHGLVSLEIEGNFASMGVDPDLLYAEEFAAL